jgi:hypothetical protein
MTKQEKLGEEMGAEFCLQITSFIPQGILTCRKILRHGTADFTSPPKEVMLLIFIALKSSSSLAGLKP